MKSPRKVHIRAIQLRDLPAAPETYLQPVGSDASGGISLNSTVRSCFLQGVPFPCQDPHPSSLPWQRSSLTEMNVQIQIKVQQLLLCVLQTSSAMNWGPRMNGDPEPEAKQEGGGGIHKKSHKQTGLRRRNWCCWMGCRIIATRL